MIKEFKEGQWYKYTGKRKLCSYNPRRDNNLVKCEGIHGNVSAAFFDERWQYGNPLILFKKNELKDFTKVKIPVIAEMQFKVISKKDYKKDNKILEQFCNRNTGVLISSEHEKKFFRVICKIQCTVEKDPIDLLKEKLKYPDRVATFENTTRGFYFAEFVIRRK